MSAGFAYLGSSPITGTAGYPVKRNKGHTIDSWQFDALSSLGRFTIVSPGAGVARTTIQATLFMTQCYKIAKVGVYCTAIDSIAGGDKFNIVVGTGTPNASGVAGNTAPFDRQRNDGYPTAFAAAGNLVFDADVAFNATNFPATSWGGAITTGAGGSNSFAPFNYDGCYLPGPLTLRVVTNASTGSISNLQVELIGCLIDSNSALNVGGMPTVDF